MERFYWDLEKTWCDVLPGFVFKHLPYTVARMEGHVQIIFGGSNSWSVQSSSSTWELTQWPTGVNHQASSLICLMLFFAIDGDHVWYPAQNLILGDLEDWQFKDEPQITQIGETDIFALNLLVELAKKLRKDEHIDWNADRARSNAKLGYLAKWLNLCCNSSYGWATVVDLQHFAMEFSRSTCQCPAFPPSMYISNDQNCPSLCLTPNFRTSLPGT